MAYSEKVVDHFNNPRNMGSFKKEEEGVGTGIVGAPECGDVMKLQIRVNDQGATRQLAESHSQVGCDEGFAVAFIGADDGQGLANTGFAEHAHQQLRAQVAKRFHLVFERRMRHNEFGVKFRIRSRGVGIAKLLRQGPDHVIWHGKSERHSGLAKANTVLLLIVKRRLDLLGREALGSLQNVPKRAIRLCDATGGSRGVVHHEAVL